MNILTATYHLRVRFTANPSVTRRKISIYVDKSDRKRTCGTLMLWRCKHVVFSIALYVIAILIRVKWMFPDILVLLSRFLFLNISIVVHICLKRTSTLLKISLCQERI